MIVSKNMGGRPARQQQLVNTSLGLMGFTMSDFFKAIEKRPTVYHFALDDADDGKVRMRRHAKWIEIAEELFPQFNKLPEVSKIKTTWRGHTGLFVKNIRMHDAGDPRFKPYIFSREMDFYFKFKRPNSINTWFPNDEDEENDTYGDQQQEPKEKSPQKRKMMQEIDIVKNELMDENFTEENKSNKKSKVSTVQVTQRSDATTSTPYSSERLRQRNSDNNLSLKLTPKSKKRLTLPNFNSNEANTRISVLDPPNGAIEQYESPHQKDILSELQLHANIEGDLNNSETSNTNIRGIGQTSTVNGNINHEEITCAPDSGTQDLSTSDSRFCSTHSVSTVINDEADLAFLESIKPSLRKISESQKLDFKIEFLQLLRKYQNTDKN